MIGKFLSVSQFYTANPTAPKQFSHLLFSHRLQRFTAVQMIKLVDAPITPDFTAEVRSKLATQFGMYEHYLEIHAKSEDEVMMPAIVEHSTGADKDRMISYQKRLAEEHEAIDKILAALKTAIATPTSTQAEVRAALHAWLSVYHAHTVYEEDEIVCGLSHLSKSQLEDIAKRMGGFFRTQEGVKYALWMMQETAKFSPGCTAIFDESLPWVVRNVVLRMIALSQDVKNFCEVYGRVQGDENAVLEKFLSQQA